MSISVTRKDQKEANENIIRRFNRKVLQSGVLSEAKASMRFSKPLKSNRSKSTPCWKSTKNATWYSL